MASKLHSSGYIQGLNGDLYFEREGNLDGQTILFVHGLGGTTNAYQMLLPDLQVFDLVRFDWSGHGRSSVPQVANIESYVNDCESIINHLGLQTIVVVGHSLGGLIALHLACKLPNTIHALVLLGPVRPPPKAGQDALAARAELVRQSGMAAVADAVISNAFARESLDKRRGEVALAREMLTRQNPHGYALAVESLKDSSPPQWSSILARTVILSGKEDKVSTIEAGKETADAVGDHAKQICLDQVGHWHMLEAPAECVKIIKTFAK